MGFSKTIRGLIYSNQDKKSYNIIRNKIRTNKVEFSLGNINSELGLKSQFIPIQVKSVKERAKLLLFFAN